MHVHCHRMRDISIDSSFTGKTVTSTGHLCDWEFSGTIFKTGRILEPTPCTLLRNPSRIELERTVPATFIHTPFINEAQLQLKVMDMRRREQLTVDCGSVQRTAKGQALLTHAILPVVFTEPF